MIWLSILFLLIPGTITASPQVSVITGNAPAYKNKKIGFFRYTDKLIDTREKVFELIINDEGYFRAEFHVNEINYVFTEYGAYHYYFYAVPGETYEIILPDPVPKTPEQLASPFFTYYPFHLTVIPSSQDEECLDINLAIETYNIPFDDFYTHLLITYYSPAHGAEKADSFQLAETSTCPVCQQDFYERYIYYKRGTLEFTSGQFNTNQLISNYFADRPPDTANPAWWELFEKVYDKHFIFLSREEKFNEIYLHIAGADYSSLSMLLETRGDLQNDTIRDLVILRELFQEFYSGNFSEAIILSLIDSVADLSETEYIKNLAHDVKKRITRLLPGSPAPSFHVEGTSGRISWPEDFEEKYLYLCFCSHTTPGCLREFEYLRYITERHSDYLQVVTVFSRISKEELEFLEMNNNYPWQLARNLQDQDIFSEYEVRATPYFVLISPDGLILLAPAPYPSADFERRLFNIKRERGDI